MINQSYGGVIFDERHFDALVKLNDLHRGQYFEVMHRGIRFTSYVGVLQVNNLLIEVLPKIEGYTVEANRWRDVLIEMLRLTRGLQVNKVGHAEVSKQSIHLLDIYFDWFIKEVEHLIRNGLIKQYYKDTKNVDALKGKIEFAGQIRNNLIHKERFFTTHQVYGKDHLIHQILAQALNIVTKLSEGTYRFTKCQSIGLNFPEVTNINAGEATFDRLSFNRKNAPYKIALDIARLIILKYSPNVKSGSEHMLALLFDMNDLWEQYILIKLQRGSKDWVVKGQDGKRFWETKTMRPDIVLHHRETNEVCIIDTKWKNYRYDNLSVQDLRQIYVYNDFWGAKTGMLLLPNPVVEPKMIDGNYHHRNYKGKIGLVSVLDKFGKLNSNIAQDIFGMLV
ncbi:McrC family protein [Pedobacter sp. MW01-1-1]|uniref:McrC family protein n=1 Tax=Pedobacter sp. MW01-1-1 TaxID=3383027 RepID=UPI003FF03B4B